MVRPLTFWSLTGLAIAGLWAVAYGTGYAFATRPDWLSFLGRFHILVLHFPIVCLLLAPLAEVVSRREKFRSFGVVATALLLVGALGAIVAVTTGSLLAVGENHGGNLVERHRLLGVLVASFAVLAAAFRLRTQSGNSRWHVRGSLAALSAACGVVIFAAHDGGSLVHGDDYLVAHAPAWLRRSISLGAAQPAVAGGIAAKNSIPPKVIARYEESIKPILRRYCYRCHGDSDAKGGIRFDELGVRFQVAQSVEAWKHVRTVLETVEMPPKDARALPEETRETLVAWVVNALEEMALVKRRENGSFPMRRLTRREFNHTYQDLFAVPAAFADQLPPDPVSEKGYDTTADLLMISNVDMQLYLETARTALDKYVHFGNRSSGLDRYFIEAEDIYHYTRGIGYLRALDLAPVPLSAEKIASILQTRKGQAPIYRNRAYGPLPFGNIPTGDVPGVGEGRGFARLHEQFLLIKTTRKAGEVVVRVHAAATPGADGSCPILRLEAGRSFDQSLKVLVAGEHDVTAGRENPGVYEFRFRLEDALPPLADSGENGPVPYLLLVLSNVARHEYGALAGSAYGQGDIYTDGGLELHPGIVRQTEEGIDSGRKGLARWQEGKPNYLYLDALEVDILPPESDPKTPWVVALPRDSADEQKIAQETLSQFARTAFRRVVTPAETDHYASLFGRLRAEGADFRQALKDAMSSILVSRSFLYIGRPAAAGERERSADLASRLSYFVWSSMPDERLINLAAAGSLADPKVLAEEVRRMLESPKGERFAEAFARQWLSLDKIKDVVVSSELYPKFDGEFAGLLQRQTIETFRDVFIHNRDARDLFRSDSMILNDQLARHYGLGPLVGGDLRRVEVGDRSKNWGGILTQGSVLTINSDGKESHPIKRGVWLLQKVLNDPPPPPPPVVPEIDATNPMFKGMTLKQKIEHHREVHACSGCHGKIDPWGIAFEEYDATGRWRATGSTNLAIDATTTLPGGKKISGARELSQYLLAEREPQIMLSLVKHLMVYALGRELDVIDEQEAENIFRSFRISGYSLKHLVLAIAQSEAFTQSNPTRRPHV